MILRLRLPFKLFEGYISTLKAQADLSGQTAPAFRS